MDAPQHDCLQLMDIWGVSTFWQCWLCCSEHWCARRFEDEFSFLLCQYLGVKSRGARAQVSVPEKLPNSSPKCRTSPTHPLRQFVVRAMLLLGPGRVRPPHSLCT